MCWKRILSPLFVVALLAGAHAQGFATPIRSRQAPSIIKRVLRERVDSTGRWRTRLGGKRSDRIRPFSAENLLHLKPGIPRRTILRKRVTGTINLRTGMVDIRSIDAPRGEP